MTDNMDHAQDNKKMLEALDQVTRAIHDVSSTAGVSEEGDDSFCRRDFPFVARQCGGVL